MRIDRDHFQRMYHDCYRNIAPPEHVVVSSDLFEAYGGDWENVECGYCERPYLECKEDPCQNSIEN